MGRAFLAVRLWTEVTDVGKMGMTVVLSTLGEADAYPRAFVLGTVIDDMVRVVASGSYIYECARELQVGCSRWLFVHRDGFSNF